MRAIVQDEYGSSPEEVLRLEEIGRPTIEDAEGHARGKVVIAV